MRRLILLVALLIGCSDGETDPGPEPVTVWTGRMEQVAITLCVDEGTTAWNGNAINLLDQSTPQYFTVEGEVETDGWVTLRLNDRELVVWTFRVQRTSATRMSGATLNHNPVWSINFTRVTANGSLAVCLP